MKHKVARLVLAVTVLFMAACSSTLYSENERGDIVVHAGFGGLVKPITARYVQWHAEGRRLTVNGPVISTDAMASFAYPGMCYGEGAVWMPHAYSNLGLYRLGGMTERAANKLPPPLREWFRGHWSYYNPWLVAVVPQPQLLEIWPEGSCRENGAQAGRQS